MLVVDDITDSAVTMDFVLKHLKAKKHIKAACTDKPSRRKVDLIADYCDMK